MLSSQTAVHSLATRALSYLQDSLGVPTSPDSPWEQQEELPYFLRDAFDLQKLELLGNPVLLAINRQTESASPADIRTWIGKIRSVAGLPTIYVTETLASYERKRLIEQKVSFIVPGNQLYLPELGLDLREYFRQRANPAQSPLSPSAQAILISALLRPNWTPDWHPGEVASALGYTPMTLSRAVRELVAAELTQVRKVGRTQCLAMNYSARETWQRAGPLLRSPVQRSIWTASPTTVGPIARLAGLSALAHRSILAEPRSTVYAIHRTAWPTLKSSVEELPEAATDAHEIQLWNYSPGLVTDSATVDPLSLLLSLRSSTDERVRLAMKELEDELPW